MTQLDASELGARIKQIRRARGLTQAAFVSDVISSGYISLIEQGKYRPSMKALMHIASVLNMSVADLLAGNDTPGTAEDLAHLVRAEVALKVGQLEDAKAELTLVSADGQKLPKCELLVATIQSQTGDALSAAGKLSELLPRLADAQEWLLFMEAIRIFDEVTPHAKSDINAFVIFTTLYRALPENVDPAVRRLLMGILARRAVELGDLDAATSLLENKNSSPISADERASTVWIASSEAVKQGNLMLAKRLAEQASDILAVRDQQRLAARIRLEQIEVSVATASPSASDLAGFAATLHELVNNLYDDEVLQTHAMLVLAETQLKLGRGAEATKSAQELLDLGRAKTSEEVRARMVLAGAHGAANRNDEAGRILGELVEFVKAADLGTIKERFLKIIARMYRDIGDASTALEILMDLEKV